MNPRFPAIRDGTAGRTQPLTRTITAPPRPQVSPSDQAARVLERLIALFAVALSCGATALWFGPHG